MRIIDLPAPERPRERLPSIGVRHLADRERFANIPGSSGTQPGAAIAGAGVVALRVVADASARDRLRGNSAYGRQRRQSRQLLPSVPLLGQRIGIDDDQRP